jgi:N-acetylneuraminate synthase
MGSPVYFIADIAANHNGSLEKAKELIELAARAGANAVKFQHFQAEKIVSPSGFATFGKGLAHQKLWEKSVYETYKAASLPWEWTPDLAKTALNCGVDFFTAPYDLEAIEFVDEYVSAFKVGSGDITWLQSISLMATKGKPVFIATGASTLEDVTRAVRLLDSVGAKFCLMQCNTNYTGISDNRKFTNIRVLNLYRDMFPNAVLGLSDHTVDNLSVVAAVSLGAVAIEKHFTDDRNGIGPDHYFSLDEKLWEKMVNEIRDLELVLGDGKKRIEDNETESVIVQRRALRYRRDLYKGDVLFPEYLIALRPCPPEGIEPYRSKELFGRRLNRNVKADEIVSITDLET